MATVFETRVMDKVGEALITGDLGITTEMLDVWLGEGARYVISKQPSQLWRLFAKEDAAFAPTTGLEVENHKIVGVFRNDGTIDQPARQIDESLRGRVLDSADINYATITDPNWYVDYSTTATPTLKIVPVSATTTIGKVIRLSFPTIDASADSSINGFPDELEDIVVDYALMQVKQREATYMRRQAQGLIDGTRIEDALDKAKVYMDDLASTDFESYVTAEDVELAATMVGGASQEVQRGLAEIQYALAEAGEFLKISGEALKDYNSMEKDLEKRVLDWIKANLI